MTLSMVNRILNGEIEEQSFAEWMALLSDVARNAINPSVRQLASEYLEFQESSGD